MTGLIFAKFSRPSARALFSRVAVITQWDGVPSLLFRMANARGNQIVEAQIHLVLARDEVTPEGESFRRLYDLELTRRQHALFTLALTTVHARYVYTARDIVWGARFVDVLSRLPDGQWRIDYARFHDVIRIDPPR